ncbi:hypothetical protein AN218_10680 [Streptomyces nanshensis]|uniref:Uncharacterized protein n=1 Tax=Streptomyces nanshensis TaxID=518642 RepID=A0A1E7L757_9ACTN|nr:hypothetical protein AN218_10680 [Streptomyces nanshensis]
MTMRLSPRALPRTAEQARLHRQFAGITSGPHRPAASPAPARPYGHGTTRGAAPNARSPAAGPLP